MQTETHQPSAMRESSPDRAQDSTEQPIVMRVRKRSGTLEPVDVNKIIQVVMNCATGLLSVDPLRVATKAISGLYDGASTKELDQLCISTASLLMGEEPEYSKLAARLLAKYIDEEVRTVGVHSFSESVRRGYESGLLNSQLYEFVMNHHERLDAAIDNNRTRLFEYFGLRTMYDRYLLKEPQSRDVFETPQYFFMRVACGLSQTQEEAIEFYNLISNHDYMPSTPTLFNSGSVRPQLSSCYLLDSPQDDLRAIYDKYTDVALLSKFAGGIGIAYHRVRSRGSLIKGTNGHSNGIVPWLKTLDSSVGAVNQGGKRKGAACVYLETWHPDIQDFLELRDNTGDHSLRTHNLNLANWVPDIFMKRVETDGIWSFFDPKDHPELTDTFGEEFEALYERLEREEKFVRQVKARDLYARMMKTLAQTGNGWMTFKDASNKKCNQTGIGQNVVHLSNLCTEILEVTSDRETAVCNLGSVNLAKHVVNGDFDFEKLAATVRIAVKFLDRVIDINFYPIDSAQSSNRRWRPVGLGVMGLQDVFFQLGLPFDSVPAQELSRKIQEEIYFHALTRSCELAEKFGAHEAFPETRAAKGELQFDSWGVKPSRPERWDQLRERIMKSGLRNSLLIAIAPTATIASLVGVYESIEPQVSNFFKRETLSGEFLQMNRYLVRELKKRGLWNEEIRTKLKVNEGSVQNIEEIPAELRNLFRTVWEVPQRAMIDMAAERGAFIDQSQSLNLFIESPTIGKLSSMYHYAWKRGIKTTYYLRSRPATRIAQVTTNTQAQTVAPKAAPDADAVACSLENPEMCEACQ